VNASESGLAEAGSIVAVSVSGALSRAGSQGAIETSPSGLALAGEVDTLSVVVAVRRARADRTVLSENPARQ